MGIAVTRHDIGAEIISILTRGMYPDPRDALREYVQNGIDAGANHMSIKIRGDAIVVEDDGSGMDVDTMRKAVRVGISDKAPNIDVGFRGIGIYSAFHLCDRLHIFSSSKSSRPGHSVIFNFKEMRDILERQQAIRLRRPLPGDKMIDLQKLLQEHIELRPLNKMEFPRVGTRVEMIDLEPNFFKSLSKFKEVAEYLQQVVPLHFNKREFKWGKVIEGEVSRICKEHKSEFRVIDLTLQVNMQIEKLYRPYTDKDFEKQALQPLFRELKTSGHFFGVAWGCLNSARKKIKNKELRGFLVNKQGFAVGRRTNIVKYFGRATFFDRYIGEIVVTNPKLLPNAARTDFEVSALRIFFYESLSKVADYYNEQANRHQEYTKGDDELDEAVRELKAIEADFAFYSENAEQLVDTVVKVRRIKEQMHGRLKRQVIRPERTEDASKVVKTAKSLEKDIQELINRARKKTEVLPKVKTPEIKSIKRVEKLPKVKGIDIAEKGPTSLVEALDQLDISVSDQFRKLFDYIDERFIQALASNEEEYVLILRELKADFEDLLSEA